VGITVIGHKREGGEDCRLDNGTRARFLNKKTARTWQVLVKEMRGEKKESGELMNRKVRKRTKGKTNDDCGK